MSYPTAHCIDCQHRDLDPDLGKLTCSKGHRPRFYAPRTPGDANWGWKRRCEDFASRAGVDIPTNMV